jgi:hypothetical protein
MGVSQWENEEITLNQWIGEDMGNLQDIPSDFMCKDHGFR